MIAAAPTLEVALEVRARLALAVAAAHAAGIELDAVTFWLSKEWARVKDIAEVERARAAVAAGAAAGRRGERRRGPRREVRR